MIWGQKYGEREAALARRRGPHEWFAWRPVRLDDGRWAWLRVVFRLSNPDRPPIEVRGHDAVGDLALCREGRKRGWWRHSQSHYLRWTDGRGNWSTAQAVDAVNRSQLPEARWCGGIWVEDYTFLKETS